MNMLAHIWIARQIYLQADNRTKKYLSLPAFILGCIWPDLDHRLSKMPHGFETELAEICQMVEQTVLINTAGSYFKFLKNSFKVGCVCHLLADFNCFAHTSQFTGQLRQHFSYELKMLFHLRKSHKIRIHRSYLSWKHQESLRTFLNRAQTLYLSDSAGFANDLAHAVNTCTIVVVRLTRRNQAIKMLAPESAINMNQIRATLTSLN